MPTSLPPSPERESSNLNGLGADAWAGIVVILAMLTIGVIYWSGHTNDATAAPASQAAGSSALNDKSLGRGIAVH